MLYDVTKVARFAQQHDDGFYYVAESMEDLKRIVTLGVFGQIGEVSKLSWRFNQYLEACQRPALKFSHPCDYIQGQMTDYQLASQYTQKAKKTEKRGIEFSLSLRTYRTLTQASECYYTGIPLTIWNFSIDRIDSSVGYVESNVVSCSTEFNSWKSVMEAPGAAISYAQGIAGLAKLNERLKAAKR
jgi:hypothetical protein